VNSGQPQQTGLANSIAARREESPQNVIQYVYRSIETNMGKSRVQISSSETRNEPAHCAASHERLRHCVLVTEKTSRMYRKTPPQPHSYPDLSCRRASPHAYQPGSVSKPRLCHIGASGLHSSANWFAFFCQVVSHLRETSHSMIRSLLSPGTIFPTHCTTWSQLSTCARHCPLARYARYCKGNP
jgi:hypothetical protein